MGIGLLFGWEGTAKCSDDGTLSDAQVRGIGLTFGDVAKAAASGKGSQPYFKGTNPKSGKPMYDYSPLRDTPTENIGKVTEDYAQGHFKASNGHDVHVYNLTHGNFVSVTHEPSEKEGKSKTKVRMHVHRGDKGVETHEMMTHPDGHDEHESHRYAESLQQQHKKLMGPAADGGYGGPRGAVAREVSSHAAAALAHGENATAHSLHYPDSQDGEKHNKAYTDSMSKLQEAGQKLSTAYLPGGAQPAGAGGGGADKGAGEAEPAAAAK